MKTLKYLLVLLVLTVSFNMFSQSGTYVREPKLNDGSIIKWTLSLNEDGTFLYHFFRDLAGTLNPEGHYYGKGIWESEGLLVYFKSDTSSLNDEFTVNLNNSKARIKRKSPRDTSDKIVMTSIWFYESESDVIKGLKLFKE